MHDALNVLVWLSRTMTWPLAAIGSCAVQFDKLVSLDDKKHKYIT
jgi:hypothetical protein